MRLTSRFGYVNQIRRDRPLTHEELMQLQVRLSERMRLWSVSGGSACSASGKCGGQSH